MKMIKLLSILLVMSFMVIGCNREWVTTPVQEPILPVVEAKVIEPAPITKTSIREAIMFEYDSYVISEEELVKIDMIGLACQNYPDTMLAIKGYASSEGMNDYNLELSLNRAEAVKSALMERFVDANRIVIFAAGSTTEFGELLNLNRRVIVLDIE